MHLHSEQLALVQRQVAHGEYEVNSERVATAILERIGAPINDRDRDRPDDAEGGRDLLRALTGLRAV